jgi:hypothetical protein
MALRLNEMVVRGIVDNREKGKVRGALWLTGCDSPIRFDLMGNCDDDLAGCFVEFTNRKPRPVPSLIELSHQVGEAGNVTASRKVRAVPEDVTLEELTPQALQRWGWTNSLYLEWFSKTDGRVVVEIIDPELRISEPSWVFTADEKAQREETASEHPIAFIHRIDAGEVCGGDQKLNELDYEKLLQKFDQHVARFEELWERYRDDPEADQKIADELGLILVHGDEDEEDDFGSSPGGQETGERASEHPDPRWFHYPLIVRAKDLCVAVSQTLNSALPPSDHFGDLHLALLQGMGKLADALHGLIEEDEPREPALLVALLKRGLSEYHSALGILDQIPDDLISAELRQDWRAEILAIRQEILNEMNRFRQSG